MTYAYDPELALIVAVLPQLDISDIPAARAQMLATREQMPGPARRFPPGW
jgi:acetyl esterase